MMRGTTASAPSDAPTVGAVLAAVRTAEEGEAAAARAREFVRSCRFWEGVNDCAVGLVAIGAAGLVAGPGVLAIGTAGALGLFGIWRLLTGLAELRAPRS